MVTSFGCGDRLSIRFKTDIRFKPDFVSALHAQSGSINFGGKTYTLGFSKENDASASLKSLREYVPKGETVANWTRMLARHEFSGITAAELAMGMQKQAKADNAEPSLATR
ncbi:MAG: hypothetical protein WCS31_02235 [Verrucomicrobiae bacterium]